MNRSRFRRRFRVSMQFLLLLMLLVAFFFLGWSTRYRLTQGQYLRDQIAAKKLQEQWMAETEMIRRETSSPSVLGVPVDDAMQMIEDRRSNASTEKDTPSSGQP